MVRFKLHHIWHKWIIICWGNMSKKKYEIKTKKPFGWGSSGGLRLGFMIWDVGLSEKVGTV